MYVICDIDENNGNLKDNIITYFAYTENSYLLRQFIHSMENLMYAYVVDEITLRKRDNFSNQIEKWIETMEISNKRRKGDSIGGFIISHCFDENYDKICIFSSEDKTMHVVLTSGIVCDYVESLYDDWKVLYYEESDLQHNVMLAHVLFMLKDFLRDKSLVSLIVELIELMVYVYKPDQLVIENWYDVVKYLVYFCDIKPII